MMYKELYGGEYAGDNIRNFGNKATHILYERIRDMVYLHEWRNSGRNRDGVELGELFLKRFRNVPIICSTLKEKVVRIARRYGFDVYKRENERIYLIRRS